MTGNDYYVYVQAMDGTPLMPTKEFGWVRKALKKGRIRAVSSKPFTVRLCYEPKERVTQPVTLGIDPGRTNIGLAAVKDDGTCLYAAECETRNLEVTKLMAERRMHRQASRRGERLARKRLAKEHGTLMQAGEIERMLPGYAEPATVKDIINTEARFNNRKRVGGWLTPTARQLLQTHMSLVRKVKKILPVTAIALEANKFSFMELEAGGHLRRPEDYQDGPMKGYASDKEVINAIQGGKCLLCGGRPIEAVHHLWKRSRNGSDTLANKAGLCRECHELVHKDAAAMGQLRKIRAGMPKQYAGTSVLNQIIPYLAEVLPAMAGGNFYAVDGWNTAKAREVLGAPKEHYEDAYCIAMAASRHADKAHAGKAPKSRFFIWQFRRQDRQLINHQTERAYLLDGKPVAKNRRRRTEQKGDSLKDWFGKVTQEHGAQEAEAMRSRLTVKKSSRSYNNPSRMLPGFTVLYEDRRLLITGQRTNGQYWLSLDAPGINIPAKKAKVLYRNAGLVYASGKRAKRQNITQRKEEGNSSPD